MGFTIVEKILSNKLEKSVKAGDEHIFSPDWIFAYDYPGYIDKYREEMLENLKITSVNNPEKYILFIDHFYPAGSSSTKENHQITRKFAKEFGFKLIEGKGIGHQIAIDDGYVKPGDFVTHFDGHVSLMGAVGAFGIGLRNSIIEAFATGEVLLQVPETIRINFTGSLSKGVASRDLFMSILDEIGPYGAKGGVIEYGGEGLDSLNLDDRLTVTNLSMFVGAVSAIMEPNENILEEVNSCTNAKNEGIYPDSDAEYLDEITIDLNDITPYIAKPHSPANVVKIEEVVGTKVDAAYLGSCASGRITDFLQANEILKNKIISDNFRLTMVPTTVNIQKKLSDMGIMSSLIESGARFHYPSCDFCFGVLGALADDQKALSTGTLNIKGRMGNDKASIYTASPYTIAASALNGRITDPRTLL